MPILTQKHSYRRERGEIINIEDPPLAESIINNQLEGPADLIENYSMLDACPALNRPLP